MDTRPSFAGATRLVAVVFLALSAAPAEAQQILKQQPLPPIDIKQYTVEPTTTSDGQSAYLHKVVIQDEVQRTITATQLLFVGNDGFTIQSLHRATLGQRARSEQKGSGAWTVPKGTASQFAVLVEKVRYLNGEIWAAEHKDMASALRAIDPEFQAARLRDQPLQAVAIEVKVEID